MYIGGTSMQTFKAISGKGIVANKKVKGKRIVADSNRTNGRAITASTDTEFFKYQSILENEGYTEDVAIWVEETLMAEVVDRATRLYAEDGIEFFEELSGQMGIGSDEVTLTYSDGTTETFSIDLEDERDIIIETMMDCSDYLECVKKLTDRLYAN